MAGRIRSPELIGRDAELAVLDAAFDHAQRRRATTVLIGGEAGIGKTRLLADWLERAAAHAIVLAGNCVPVADGCLSFGPLAEAVRPVLDGVISDGESGLLRRLTEEFRGIDEASTSASRLDALSPFTRSRLYETFLELVRALAARRTVLIAIEDLHWADVSTLDLLSYVVRAGRAERVMLVATFRSDEVESRRGLLRWLGELQRLPEVDRVELGPLAADEVARQMAAILQRPIEPAASALMHARSDGNPFFVEELVAAGIGSDELPPSLHDVLQARLREVSDGTRHILGVAAIVGRTVDHELLAQAGRVSERAVADALQEAVQAGLLVVQARNGRPGYAFRHALLAEVAATDVVPARRSRLHAAIAEALSASPVRAGAEEARRLAEIAHHWLSADRPEKALPACVEAAQAAVARSGYAEGRDQYERALEEWHRVAEPDEVLGFDRVELLTRAAHAAVLSGSFDTAVTALREAIERAHDRVEPTREGLLYERLGRALYWAGAFTDGVAAYETALRLVPAVPASVDRARVVAGRVQTLVLAGRVQEAVEEAVGALEVARAAGARQLEGHLLTTIGTGLGQGSDVERGLSLMREGLAIAQEVGDIDDIFRAYANLTSCLGVVGRYREAVDLGNEGIEAARRYHTTSTEGAYVTGNTAYALTMLGRWDEAMALLRDTAARAVGAFRLATQRDLAGIAALRGDHDEASLALDEVEGRTAGETEAQWLALVAANRIELSITTGDLVTGRSAADRSQAAWTSAPFYSAAVLVPTMKLEAHAAERARAHRDGAAVELSRRRATRQLAALANLPVPPNAAMAAYLRRALAIARAEMSRVTGAAVPASWRDVLALSDATSGVYEIAYARFRLAESLLATGRTRAVRDEAHPILAQAYEAAAILGARPLCRDIQALARRTRLRLELRPAPSRALPSTGDLEATQARGESTPPDCGLTFRETEVLRLLVAGCTNREIADALFISESTAGVHVSHILAKLDVHRRVEAATIGARLGFSEAVSGAESKP